MSGGASGSAVGKRTLTDELYGSHAVVPDPLRMPDPKPIPQEETKRPPGELTGIGATIAIDRFVTAAKAVQKVWGTLTPDERAKKLGEAAKAELDIHDVYPVDPQLEDLGARLGEFHFKSWILGLGRTAFSVATIDDAGAAEVASTVYHEARHAEQWFRMARLLISEGKTPQEITDGAKIPLVVTQRAKQHPLASKTSQEGKEAVAWFDSVYGANAVERSKMLTKEPVLRKAFDDAVAENDRVAKDPASTQAAKTEAARKVQEATATYRTEILDKYNALPEEADGHAIAAKLKAKYLKK
jgi:hypothetical protein